MALRSSATRRFHSPAGPQVLAASKRAEVLAPPMAAPNRFKQPKRVEAYADDPSALVLRVIQLHLGRLSKCKAALGEIQGFTWFTPMKLMGHSTYRSCQRA